VRHHFFRLVAATMRGLVAAKGILGFAVTMPRGPERRAGVSRFSLLSRRLRGELGGFVAAPEVISAPLRSTTRVSASGFAGAREHWASSDDCR
jgi:hypothetical protein